METELATEARMDGYEDCETVGTWTKYRYYTIFTGKIMKAFFRAMKYLYFLKHT